MLIRRKFCYLYFVGGGHRGTEQSPVPLCAPTTLSFSSMYFLSIKSLKVHAKFNKFGNYMLGKHNVVGAHKGTPPSTRAPSKNKNNKT